LAPPLSVGSRSLTAAAAPARHDATSGSDADLEPASRQAAPPTAVTGQEQKSSGSRNPGVDPGAWQECLGTLIRPTVEFDASAALVQTWRSSTRRLLACQEPHRRRFACRWCCVCPPKKVRERRRVNTARPTWSVRQAALDRPARKQRIRASPPTSPGRQWSG
jgi:hypothetical protein